MDETRLPSRRPAHLQSGIPPTICDVLYLPDVIAS